MQNHLNALDSLQVNRHNAACDLYLKRGSGDASLRCDVNEQFGAKDFSADLARHLELCAGETVVDVGCGSGQHLLRFAKAVSPGGQAVGFDFSLDAVKEAQRRGVLAGVADAAGLPLLSESVDALTCNFAVYYFSDLKRTLFEWNRTLRFRGRLVVSGPATDTNSELYAFHYAVTGREPSDVDLMALGYIDSAVMSLLPVTGFGDILIEKFTNPIVFTNAEKFISYWHSTSLFIRSIPDDERDDIIKAGQAFLHEQQSPFVITKQITIAVAKKL